MDQTNLIVEQQGPLLRVVINRPAVRNALSRSTLAQLKTVFSEYAGADEIKVALLTGAGDKSFAAGGDLQEFDGIRSREETRQMSALGFDCLRAIKQFPIPVVAAVNGTALGGGAELAMACDYRLAAATARIGFIQGKLGVSSSWGGAIYLAERIGASNAMRLLTTAQVLDSQRALALNVVDAACAAGDSLESALEAFIAPMLKIPAHSLRAAKSIAIDANALWLERLRDNEHGHFVDNWLNEEHWALASQALNNS